MKVKIQFATIKNLRDIQNLNHQLCIKENKEFDATIRKNYSLSKVGEKYFKKRITNDCALIALIDKKIVGYLIGSIIEEEDYRNISKLAEAEDMIILKEYRNLGIGKQLFNGFFRWCKSKKVKRVRAITSFQNKNTIAFIKGEGFREYNLIFEKDI
jgi:GNAT superfamily N-acetyltransferase